MISKPAVARDDAQLTAADVSLAFTKSGVCTVLDIPR